MESFRISHRGKYLKTFFFFLVTSRKELYLKTLDQVLQITKLYQFCCQILAKGRRSVALMRYYAEEEKREKRSLVFTGGLYVSIATGYQCKELIFKT